jgi:MFS family permease
LLSSYHTMSHFRILIGISIFWLPLSLLLDGLTVLVLPAHLLSITDSAKTATRQGLITFVGLLAAMLIQPVAGLYSDRIHRQWGRWPFLTAASALAIVALVLFGISSQFLTILVTFTLVQMAASAAQAAQQGFLPDLIPRQRRGIASGLKNFMDIAGATIAFVVLGQLLAGGHTWPALIAIGLVILLFLPVIALLVRERLSIEPDARPVPRLADVFRLDVHQHRAFLGVVLARFLFLLGTYAIGRFMLLFVSERLGLDVGGSSEQTASLLAVLTLMTALAALPGGWAADRFGRVPLMLLGATISAIGAILFGMAGSILQMLLFGTLLAIGSAAFSTGNWALAADLAPRGEAARFLALANLGTAGAAALAGLFGLLIDLANRLDAGAGFTALFAAAAIAFIASVLVVRWIVVPAQQNVVAEASISPPAPS